MSGMDGFPAEYYKVLKDTVSPLLLKCFNFVLQSGEIRMSWRQAIISVIPKTGKDKTECSPYRPLSKLNSDYRVFASIKAKRLENIIPHITDDDQTGFL